MTADAVREELMASMQAYADSEYEESDNKERMEQIMLQCIEDAVQEILLVMYPNGYLTDSERAKVEEYILNTYKNKVRYIAEYHWDKQGKEGVILYSENDTSSHFESSGTPASYLTGIIPIAIIN